MAKKKVVLKVKLNDPKRRQKTLQIAAGFPGITSASVEDDRIVLVGDGLFDPVTLTNVLRKRVSCCVELISVGEEKEKKKEEKKPAECIVVPPPPYACIVPDYGYDSYCTVM
ncbi:uncharacterized protein LOC109724638 [Ananas comosus]|uniref:Uncharacterized protein LOC109724638 n=1 Tax=Ananas comosus TaxID=4615 RepID=A0A6P5GMH6_ANACO|nr:uncharacterized protein LOC109724638 [Ananas comosus]